MMNYKRIDTDKACYFMARQKLEYMFVHNVIERKYFKGCHIWGFFNDKSQLKGIVFLEPRDNCWELHIAFAPDCRGKEVIKVCKNWTLNNLKCYNKIIGRTPVRFKGAVWLIKAIGFKITDVVNNYVFSELVYE